MLERLMDEKVLPYLFKEPKHPMRFNELMQANKLLVDNMPLEGKIPGVKLIVSRLYILMITVWHLVILPPMLIFHSWIAKIDCHIMIVAAVFFTLLFFGLLSIFRSWAIERMALNQIKKAWKLHLPYYDFGEYYAKVAKFYTDAIEKGVTGANVEMYIMNALSLEK